ncbi:MAG: hypothetical protein GY712_04285, partial [Oceanicoccus sp.]|uniref:hypothetical protein n=1 Tax=Oceanicoccus sp. TaxID=2691044 RepID=UPI00262019F7
MWTARTFGDMPKYATAVTIPNTASRSGPLTTISELNTAIADTSIDVIEWAGDYEDTQVTINQGTVIPASSTRYITGPGDLPPLLITGGATGKELIITDMTFGSDTTTEIARIWCYDAQYLTIDQVNSTFNGHALISIGNSRSGTTKNITIQKGVLRGTQAVPTEYAAIILKSRCRDMDYADWAASGNWPGRSENVHVYDMDSDNMSDFFQSQANDPGDADHYSTIDHKDTHIAG